MTGRCASKRTGWVLACTIAALLVLVVGWRSQRGFIPLHAAGGFSVNGEFKSNGAFRVRGPRYGSWSGDDRNTGTLVSEPFVAPAALALMLVGFPSHSGERFELVRVADPNARTRLDVGPDPRECWVPRVVSVPPSWRGAPVRFVATDGGTKWGDWIGLGDLRAANLLDRLLTVNLSESADLLRLQLLLFTGLALLLVFPGAGWAGALCRRLNLGPPFVFAVTLVLLGLWAEATFFIALIAPAAANVVVVAVAIIGSVATLRALRSAPARSFLTHRDSWIPFAVTALISVSYTALVSFGVPLGDSITGSVETWLHLPIDNYLPHLLALHVAAHAPPKPFVGDWLSSDRPPLQAGFDLLFAALVPGSDEVSARYQAVAVLLQTTIFGSLYGLCRSAGASRLRSAAVLLLAATSGFFFLNSVFVWPKLLAASFGAVAMLFFAAGQLRRFDRAALIGIGTGLALLSHGGVVFTLPALVVAWIWRDRAAALRPLGVAAAMLLLVMTPWTWYQKSYDPPGDRLLKMHLAGRPAVTADSFAHAFMLAYTTVPPASLVGNKLENVAEVLGLNTPRIGRATIALRDRQFFYVRYALSALVIPYLAALCLVGSRRRLLRTASRYAWIALGANAFWCLAMYGPGTTSVHQGSYLTVALMYAAAGCVATQWPLFYALVLSAQVALFITAWTPIYQFGGPLTAGRIADLAVLVGVAALTAAWSTKAVVRRWRSPALRVKPTVAWIAGPGARDLLVVCAVAATMLAVFYATHYGLALLLAP